ncbi:MULTISPECIES: HDOD domain-containing protein [unclassified Treponema]|uniref:HDOD domain-containing protein n=1 Tax=unclassified Treponema TaxID=2638727 RepID=UPI0025D3CAB4|nr:MULTISPECIES: HDOD domain-containing protein [unclassified Treponema]
MPPVKKVKLDLSKIKMAIRAGIPLSITTYTLPREMEAYIDSVLKAFLNELNQNQMSEYLTYCLNELLTNGKKANTKRIFFKQKNLDIFNAEQYSEGIKNFKRETLSNIRYYLDLQKKAGLYVKLILQARNNKIKIEVRNNSELTVEEYKRMHDKLSRAQQYTSVDQATNQVLDETEGAGLGLIIMILILEKIGLTEENFQILCENGETITRIILPLDEKTQNNLSVVSREFVNLIDELPQFPDSVMRINRLLNNPDSKMSEIATLISSDISLTSDLLRLVNSATFALASPCRSISDAVKLVGIRGIKNMILSVSSMNVLNTLGEETKALWTHAYRVAFYTYNLARNFYSSDRTIVEDSYICGLLHDMGKLIFETTHPAYINRIKDICAQKGIQPDIFEKLVAGVNHGEIGALIAEKWNFPEVIVSVIRHHHEPDLAPENVKKLTEIVYLSDMIAHYQIKDIDFYQFDQEVLAKFHITNEIQMQKISDSLEKAFDKESQ